MTTENNKHTWKAHTLSYKSPKDLEQHFQKLKETKHELSPEKIKEFRKKEEELEEKLKEAEEKIEEEGEDEENIPSPIQNEQEPVIN